MEIIKTFVSHKNIKNLIKHWDPSEDIVYKEEIMDMSNILRKIGYHQDRRMISCIIKK